MTASALYLFAHRALSSQFHEDPRRFVRVLEGGAAAAAIESAWQWARQHDPTAPPKAPLRYEIHRPDNGVILVMSFTGGHRTGEPSFIQFIIKEGNPHLAYARMFVLEHSEHVSEREGRPMAIVCESCPDGRHVNHATLLDPGDEAGFNTAVRAILGARTS